MRSVQIYVENRILDLFSDEQIVVNSTVQNITDIGKVFTDFSQTFTIPCSDRNNQIFEYYFQNDLDGVIDHNLRRDARIEIDHIPFRTGKIQLEKSEVKSTNAESYTVSFYGDVVNIKDLVGEDKLSDLDYDTLDHTYSGAEIQARVETDFNTADYNVRWPLISSGRVWQYGSAGANDISLNTAPIDFTELFPAVRVKSILDIIASQYGLTFTGSFLDTKQFRHAYLWYKNKEKFQFFTRAKQLKFGESGVSTDILYNNKVQYSYVSPADLIVPPYDTLLNTKHITTVEIVTASNIDYYLDVYDNGFYLFSQLGNGTQIFNIINENNTVGLNRSLSFKLRSTAAMTFTNTVTYKLRYNLFESFTFTSPVLVIDTYSDSSNTSISTTVTTDLSFLAPNMKIVDFINGLVNTYNLTVTGTDLTTFKIEPLDVYYNSGIDWDITPYTSFESITVNRPKLYKNISFKWQQCLSFMNREFFDLFKREYSDLSATFDYDGGDYTIQLPFETPLHSKFTNTNLQVAYCLGTEPEYKNYVPKPTLLYMYDYQDINVSLYFDNGTTVDQVTGYVPFGQDMNFAQEDYTLNFGSEFSSLSLDIVNNTLYREYYESYLLNLYNLKTRITTVKCSFPLHEMTSIRLNDSLIIRDKKYLINDMKQNLVTGEVELVLLSNWREAQDYNQSFTINCAAQTLDVAFSISPDTTITIGTPLETQFATPDDTTPIGEQTVVFTCTANGGVTRTNTFPLTIVVRGVTLPTQYITITQYRCIIPRILEGTGFTNQRVTENRQNRISE
jgi:hypothetical protein